MSTGFWTDRPVLVTGASGLLGGWVVGELLGRGSRVAVLVRDAAPRSLFVRNGYDQRVDLVHGALDDRDLLRRTIAEYEIRSIFHLAAQTQVRVAKVDPIGTLEANVRGTWNLLEAARTCGHADVVVASSDKAYGALPMLPYTEEQPLQGRFPYDVSKSCADLICAMYAATYGLPVAVTRCANLYGGGDLNFDRLIPGVIRATLAGDRFVIRSDGQFVRDYLYVEDAVDAYLMLGEQLARTPALKGEAFNVGADERRTVLQVVEEVLAILGRPDLEPFVQNQASAEIREQYLSAAKIRRQLSWRPQFTLAEGLARTAAWYRDYRATEFNSSTIAGPALAAGRV